MAWEMPMTVDRPLWVAAAESDYHQARLIFLLVKLSNKKAKIPASHSLAAGAIAGAVEATFTYPTEYVKTQLQLQSKTKPDLKLFDGPWDCVRKTVREKGFFGLYRGLSALVIGTASKAGVRFLAFEQFKKMLADENGKVAGQRIMLAGLGAGVAEAIIAVTPTETIKTKLIHDQNSPNPKYHGLIHGTRAIIRTEGIAGIYRGMTAVIARQGANSAVRLTTYGLLKDRVQDRYPVDPVTRKNVVPWYVNFANGAVAGIVTVYTTMPLDVVKTRMQALNAKELYHNSVHCLYRITTEEGVKALWKGATPRLGRLIFSGGIVFTVYEQIVAILARTSR
ncbi:mitochondrial tricarboxylate transporter [Fimicolochytrium jonesii]|uniref:mitochondrial tricarboxylate transporter n=1 Tax=Fimicolochytrium jonesii TaxID=1396493 RepID=UPI0022FE69BE|nr:mitochondrial tricarboxylate transporter [Fimicolochytrium jonesii]KAI8825290.1 mitochondrial tricarboxylate transporter [Fimicolochytrium jonesii]